MKCSQHPEVDAVGICVNCGNPVCKQCKRELGIKIYCHSCARKYFEERAAARASAERQQEKYNATPTAHFAGIQPTGTPSTESSDRLAEAQLLSTLEAQDRLASRWVRLGARLIDALIALPFFIITTLWFFISFDSTASSAESTFILIVGLIIFAPYFIVQWVLLSKYGQAIGKKLVRIKIVKVGTGQNGGFIANVLLREWVNGILCALPYIGELYQLIDVLFIFREDKRCIHDFIAGTHVVEKD